MIILSNKLSRAKANPQRAQSGRADCNLFNRIDWRASGRRSLGAGVAAVLTCILTIRSQEILTVKTVTLGSDQLSRQLRDR